MKHERELDPEGTTSMIRECDRLSKARHRALESESEALLRKEHDRAKKRTCKTIVYLDSEMARDSIDCGHVINIMVTIS